MREFYVAGIPYSGDDLYHYGIPKMKWHVRRFQNLDRTWTEEGKIRYGRKSSMSQVPNAAAIVGKAVGNAAKTVGKHALDKFVDKHPWMYSDEQLRDRSMRLEQENALKRKARENKNPVGKGRKLVGDILETSAKTLASGATQALVKKIFDDTDPMEKSFARRFANWDSYDKAEKDKLTNEFADYRKAKSGKIEDKDPVKEFMKSKYADLAKKAASGKMKDYDWEDEVERLTMMRVAFGLEKPRKGDGNKKGDSDGEKKDKEKRKGEKWSRDETLKDVLTMKKFSDSFDEFSKTTIDPFFITTPDGTIIPLKPET